MEFLDDYITTKYNILLADLKAKLNKNDVSTSETPDTPKSDPKGTPKSSPFPGLGY